MNLCQRLHEWLAELVAVSLVIATLSACDSARPNASANSAKNSNSAELFTIPPEQMSHVQVLTVQPTILTRTLRLTGAVAYNSFRTTPVITQVSGPVSRIVVVPGKKVTRGESMMYVASPDYSQVRTNYLKAKEAYVLAQKADARARDLYQHQAIAEQNVEQADSAEVQAGGDLAAAQAALKVMGITDPDDLVKAPASFEVPVKAPIDGLVVEQDVSAGQLIQPGTTQCFMISDVRTVWVLVNVYQKDLPYVRVGDPVTIQTDTYPEVFHGRIAYVAASLDPSTRTLQARIETNNAGEELKKDMYVVATCRCRHDSPCHSASRCRSAARLGKPALCLRRRVIESVWQTFGDARGEYEWADPDYERAESWATKSSGMAACSCSLRILCSARGMRQAFTSISRNSGKNGIHDI